MERLSREMYPVLIKLLNGNATVPTYAHIADAGFDIYLSQDETLQPHEVKLLHTGIALHIPLEYEVQIRLRSGTSRKYPIIVPNAPATVDSGYTGEILIPIRNLSDSVIEFKQGMALVQGVLNKVPMADFHVVDTLPETDRGGNGFGSTDK